jgi:nucleoside-diphosphate-sugar epimerase
MTKSVKDKNIAIVGGAGFIGHNLALTLKKRGANVQVIDNLQVNNLGALYGSKDLSNRGTYLKIIHERLDLLYAADVPLHVLDARDYHLMCNALNEIEPDIIVHLAAVAHANQSNKDPHSTFDHSLRTLENSLDNARGNVDQFIYLSSSMIYGNFATGEVDEETPCDPLGIYGALKFSGEKMVIGYNQVFDLPYTIIRPSALYGQRCVSRRVGQIFIENAMNGHDISIQGDGSDKLDFTYIKDFVNGLILTMETDKAKNEIFNLTYGDARSLKEMADILKNYFPEANILHKDWDRLMPKRGTLSIEKAKSLLGYEPEYSLEKGFVEYIEWYQSMEGSNDKNRLPLVVE